VSICLIDTTVFCNVVPVPGLDQDREDVCAQLRAHVQDGVTLLLPVAAIVETGNHVARNRDGNVRRATAVKFVRMVKQAIEGETPFTPTPFLEPAGLLQWLDEFPQFAMEGMGLGDLSIVKEWEAQCRRFPGRRVFIWSLDRHLASYDNSLRGSR